MISQDKQHKKKKLRTRQSFLADLKRSTIDTNSRKRPTDLSLSVSDHTFFDLYRLNKEAKFSFITFIVLNLGRNVQKNATRCMYRCCIKNENCRFRFITETLVFWPFVSLFFQKNDTRGNATDAAKGSGSSFFNESSSGFFSQNDLETGTIWRTL